MTEPAAHFVRFGARKRLIDGECAEESLGRSPALAIDEFLAQHADLRDRAAKREQTQAQEPHEDRADGQALWRRLGWV